ncbi:hypothetical protein H5P36_12675 [Bacillus sp. APMAM]|nr:hypothetical protein [Bacillus sp. APMAM]RTZ55550.1 hypothetical protein EKO25_11925 [Bacillus sp. SAJ1]
MPRIGITAYDLLVSCPGDVIEYLDVIKESVENFNRMFGVINNIEVVTKHWSTDSYPQSGGKPQELLNKQFVRDCDAAIAIFWTRFGTPTDKYGSGTEEEIEEMLSEDKQVFMYFLDAPINPSQVDMDQYKKIKEFREKYKDKGIYAVVKDKHELQREFTNHLAMHFLPLISGEKVTNSKKVKPILQIRDVNALTENGYYLYNNSLCNSKFVIDKNEAIINKIHTLQSKILPTRTVVDLKDNGGAIKDTPEFMKNIDVQKLIGKTKIASGVLKDAEVFDDWKETIRDFAEKNEIEIDDDFWNLGDLKKRTSIVALPFGNSGSSLEGTEEEKQRYESLKDLYWDVEAFNEYITYFNHIDNLSVSKLAISNVGNSFDEDIDVKLIIPKGFILRYSDLPDPGINIIEELLDIRFADFIFSIQENENVGGYEYHPMQPPSYTDIMPTNPFNQISSSEKYKMDKEKYSRSLECIFHYKIFESEKNDILTFHIKYLKHNTSMAFPSILMFKDIPAFIEYEITSKHIPEMLKGKIEFHQE